MHAPLAETRRIEILRRLAEGQAVNATDLAAEFLVSEDAVRRDLRALATEGKCRRVYGGALPLSPGGSPLDQRMLNNTPEKHSLVATAHPLFSKVKTVFLDSGSTNLILARHMPVDQTVTVATNSVAIAAALLERQSCTVIMIGGELNRVTGAAIGPSAIKEAERFNFDLCFLGACAVSLSLGLGAFHQADAEFKRTLVANSNRVAVLVTRDKVETRAPFQVVGLSSLHHLVLEHGTSEDVLAAFSGAGLDVLVAQP